MFLRQVHGTRVVRVGAADALPEAPPHEADASVTTEPGVACTVQVADCLPVLFAAPGGRGVAAAHAGWRGLAAGVLEATRRRPVRGGALPSRATSTPGSGSASGRARFEVGADVLEAFASARRRAGSAAVHPGRRPGKWLADLAGLARDRLAAAGVERVSAAAGCAVEDASRFFSYRRDRRHRADGRRRLDRSRLQALG